MRRLLLVILAFLAAHAAQAAEAFRDCPQCPEMIAIKPGTFAMGGTRAENEQPVHTVTLTKPYAIAKYELTFDEWEMCRVAGACTRDPDLHDWGRGRQPVINLAIADIAQYLAWLSKLTGKTYRLPSEADWEYAARGGIDGAYWWGETMKPGHANCRDCGAEPWGGDRAAPVGTFPPNPYGLHEMNGNLWEWTADCWAPNHNQAPTDGSPRPGPDNCQRVIKGGAWYYYAPLSRPASRARQDPRQWSYTVGVRLAREME
ncbi:MAG: SUMF1/EgtB/PvdO family nonheme iron enzyme [Rhodospirillales bacterium]|nr:SUMF1/EgtB/PvdO family nonheme iron enzyme [Rhodospirillales bacterium]